MIGLVVLAVLVATGLLLTALSQWRDGPSGSVNVIEGSGTAVSEIRAVAPFDSIDLAGANNVSISVGAEQSVRVRADDNLVGRITTDVRAAQLVIDNRGSFRSHSPIRVEITLPVLDAVSLSGSGTLTVQAVRADALTVALPGSGTIRVSGTADRLRATVDGSGDLRLNNLTAARATAVVSGSGLIQLVATEALDAKVSGTGSILYGGVPNEVTKNITGTGAIVEQ
jgi:hypothetical protein